MLFWFIALALSLLVAVPLAVAMWRGRGATGTMSDDAATVDTPAARPELALYRDQLAGVERDLERGVLSADEAERLRTEVSRRLLDADRNDDEDATAPRRAPRGATLVMMALALMYFALMPWWKLQMMVLHTISLLGLIWLMMAPGLVLVRERRRDQRSR